MQAAMELTDINVIKMLGKKYGFKFSKSMGQNFLTESWVPEQIAASIEDIENKTVFEIGPGIGCLTKELLIRAQKVVTIELDKSLEPLLKETLGAYDNLKVIYADAMKQDFTKLVSDNAEGREAAFCANLPYNITSPILTKLIDAQVFSSITVMIQKEVADRICAAPGTTDYGAFTAYINWRCSAEKLFDVQPDAFFPMPKVTSSVICLKPLKKAPAEVKDQKLMQRIIKAAFSQRRKTLLNALSAGLSEYNKADIAKAIISIGMGEKVRGEQLHVTDFAKLSDLLSEKQKISKID